MDRVFDAGERILNRAVFRGDCFHPSYVWRFERADEQAFEIRGIGPHRTGPYTGLAILINCAKRHQEFLDTPASFDEVHNFPNKYLTFTLHVQNTNLLKPVFEESLLDLRR